MKRGYINEYGNTPKGQRNLGMVAQRALQRADRTSGADKQRFMKTYDKAYNTAACLSNKYLGGTYDYFDKGLDDEFERWENENMTESRHTNRKLIRLTENDLHKIVKESVNRVLSEAINELDWRTYANAARKRDAQIQQLGRNATDKGGNRLTNLRNKLDYAASDALTSKYGQRHNNGHPTNNADVYTNNGYQTITTNNFDGKGKWSRGEFNYDNKGEANKQGYSIDSPIDNEVNDYMNGKAKYVKGKGWK